MNLVQVVLGVALLLVLLAAVYREAQYRRKVSALEATSRSLQTETGSRARSLAALQQRWDEVLDEVNEGIVILRHSSTPVFANRSARQLLGLEATSLPPRLPSEEITSLVRRVLSGDGPVEEVVKLRTPQTLTLEVRTARLASSDDVLLSLRDVSEEARTHTMRRQFVSHASHELKSPVSSIHALAEAILEAADHDPGRLKGFSARLTEETARLGRLVVDLLDLSRLEEPTVISNRTVRLSEVAARELAYIKERVPEKDLIVTGEVEPDVTITGDEQQLGLLLRNLLENAVRYTSAGGRVALKVTRAGSQVVVEVKDSGAGIPLKAQSRVFERFYRVDEGRARSEGGTGLGLAIVKHVAELHGGSVELRSELGEGSTFTVHLPSRRSGN